MLLKPLNLVVGEDTCLFLQIHGLQFLLDLPILLELGDPVPDTGGAESGTCLELADVPDLQYAARSYLLKVTPESVEVHVLILLFFGLSCIHA